MNRVEKSENADKLKTHFLNAKLAVFADYKGLSSNGANTLRRFLRPHNVVVKVVKNNLVRHITKQDALGKEAKDLMDTVVGPTLITFAFGDVAAVAKVLDQFAKDNEAFGLKPSLMGKKRIEVDQIQELASLKDVLIGKLLSCINGPARSMVGVLSAVPRSLVQVLAAIENKKSENQS